MIDAGAIVQAFLATNIAAPATGTLHAEINATTLTITLGSGEGAAFPSSQTFAVKIESELMIVTRSGDVLTVEPEGRGSFGTTAATHAATTTVSQANLYLLVGDEVYWPDIPSGFANTVPAVRFFIRGGSGEEVTHKPSLQMECMGGSGAKRDCNMVYRALYDRLQNAHGQATTNGILIGAYEEMIGADRFHPDADWPYNLSFWAAHCGPA